MNNCQTLLQQLITHPSVTPLDEGCQDWMCDFLSKLGFRITCFPNPPVDNFYAEIGNSGPLFVFAGHTDVVSPGDLKQWNTRPFEPQLIDGKLYGRGAADMKGSLAAMLVASQRWCEQNKQFNGRLGFLITSAEEGDQFDLGTPYVMEQLAQSNNHIDFCLVGEPSSTNTVGDVIKVGRRGSLTGDVTVSGVQGHVAYPHLADNPIHQASQAIAELCSQQWDAGNDFFPATTFQISNINAGTGAGNVIPGELRFKFNFRYSTETTHEQLQNQVEEILSKHQVNANIKWRLNGKPFLTDKGRLVEASVKAIQNHTTLAPDLSTTGGTSDGRFIAPYGVEVIELGPVNATIHQANECTDIAELETLSHIYYDIIKELLL